MSSKPSYSDKTIEELIELMWKCTEEEEYGEAQAIKKHINLKRERRRKRLEEEIENDDELTECIREMLNE